MCQHEPVQYPVDRRPPRDWFSPIAMPVAAILCWLAILGSIAIIAYGSYNLGARAPTAVQVPEHSTYEDDVSAMPTVDLTDQKLTRMTVTVRNRDRDALMLHVHNSITAQGGTLVSGHVYEKDANGATIMKPVTKDRSLYHIPTDYLTTLEELTKPGWRQPLAYAEWTLERRAEPNPANGPPASYVVINTRHLLFENRRNQVITMAGTAGIVLSIFTAFLLSAFTTSPSVRGR